MRYSNPNCWAGRPLPPSGEGRQRAQRDEERPPRVLIIVAVFNSLVEKLKKKKKVKVGK